MIKSRLITLADHLEKIAARPPKRREFSLVGWFSRRYKREKNKDIVCGYCCCAIGEATFIPAFKKLGLYMDGSSPAFKEYWQWDAVKAFFGLTYDEANYLFSYMSYAAAAKTTPAQVSTRIRDFAAPQMNRGVKA